LETQSAPKLDTALICLATAAKILGIPADEQQLRRAYAIGSAGMDITTLLRAAKDIGLKARLVTPDQERFSKLPIPSIAILQNGNCVVVGRTKENAVTLIDPYRNRPISLPLEQFLQAWSGEIVLLTRRMTAENLSGQLSKKFNLTWFLPVFWRFRRAFSEVIAASFGIQMFGLVTPVFFQIIIDRVLVHRGTTTLDILVFGMLFVYIFQTLITYLRGYLFVHTANKIDVILGTRLYRHISALALRFFEERRVGDTVARVRELENIRNFITGTALTLVLDTFFAVVYIAAMFYYNMTLSLIVVAALPVFALLTFIFTPVFKRQLNVRFAAYAENYAFLIESITGIQTLKSLALETQFHQKWEQSLARYVKMSFDTTNMANIFGSIGQMVSLLTTLGILWLGANFVMDGKMSVGELVAFNMLASQVTRPVLRLVNIWQSFQQAQLSIDRLGDILNVPAEPAFNPNRTTLSTIEGEVVFDNVGFRYRSDGPEVLRELSFKLKPGTRVGIVGRSGSGKSTIIKLIQRLYVAETGQVLIDGIDVAQVEPAWLRRQIGFVLQESFLFNGSVKDNIAMARPEAAAEEIVQAARMAGADEFIRELPEGYETNVGERGGALSGGQRQRIAIARALITNPRILIFDEATSALDYESERVIMDNLDTICANRTVIIIAHRLSTVEQCDTILVIDRGRLAEQGTHRELLALGGIYQNLHSQQEG